MCLLKGCVLFPIESTVPPFLKFTLNIHIVANNVLYWYIYVYLYLCISIYRGGGAWTGWRRTGTHVSSLRPVQHNKPSTWVAGQRFIILHYPALIKALCLRRDASLKPRLLLGVRTKEQMGILTNPFWMINQCTSNSLSYSSKLNKTYTFTSKGVPSCLALNSN